MRRTSCLLKNRFKQYLTSWPPDRFMNILASAWMEAACCVSTRLEFLDALTKIDMMMWYEIDAAVTN